MKKKSLISEYVHIDDLQLLQDGFEEIFLVEVAGVEPASIVYETILPPWIQAGAAKRNRTPAR